MEYEEPLQRVCAYFGVTLEDLRKRDTSSKVSYARSFVYYILHIDLRLSNAQTARILDRKTRIVRHTVSHIKYNIEHNKDYRKTYQELLPYIYDI